MLRINVKMESACGFQFKSFPTSILLISFNHHA